MHLVTHRLNYSQVICIVRGDFVEEFGDLFLDGEYYRSPEFHHLYKPRAEQRNTHQKQQVFSPWKGFDIRGLVLKVFHC